MPAAFCICSTHSERNGGFDGIIAKPVHRFQLDAAFVYGLLVGVFVQTDPGALHFFGHESPVDAIAVLGRRRRGDPGDVLPAQRIGPGIRGAPAPLVRIVRAPLRPGLVKDKAIPAQRQSLFRQLPVRVGPRKIFFRFDEHDVSALEEAIPDPLFERFSPKMIWDQYGAHAAHAILIDLIVIRSPGLAGLVYLASQQRGKGG